ATSRGGERCSAAPARRAGKFRLFRHGPLRAGLLPRPNQLRSPSPRDGLNPRPQRKRQIHPAAIDCRRAKPLSGRIEVDGAEVTALEMRLRAQRIALVSQESELLFPLRVWEYVLQGRYPYGRRL